MRIPLALLALAVVLAGCSSDAPRVAPTTPSPTSTAVADLGALLPSKVPEEYTFVPEQSGPISFEEAVAGDDDPDAARKRLSANGYVRGYARQWETELGDAIVVIVNEFTTDAGAKAEYDASLAQAAAEGATRFEVNGIEGAVGLTQIEAGESEGESVPIHAVAFVRGRLLFVAAVGGVPGHEPEEAIALARQIAEGVR